MNNKKLSKVDQVYKITKQNSELAFKILNKIKGADLLNIQEENLELLKTTPIKDILLIKNPTKIKIDFKGNNWQSSTEIVLNPDFSIDEMLEKIDDLLVDEFFHQAKEGLSEDDIDEEIDKSEWSFSYKSKKYTIDTFEYVKLLLLDLKKKELVKEFDKKASDDPDGME